MKTLPRLLLATTLLLPPAAQAGTQELQITSTGHPAAYVQIRGHGAQLFGVDTGASASAIYETFREKLDLVPEPGAQIEMYGTGGSQIIQRYRLPRMSVAGVDAGQLLVSGFPSGIKHGEGVMGVLGRDVLGAYMVEFDMVSSRLGLHAPEAVPASEHGWDTVPIRLMPQIGFVMLDVTLNGTPVTAVLDTGASRTFMNWHAARAAGLTPQSPGLKAETLASGVTRHAFPYHVGEFSRIDVGNAAFGQNPLAIGDLPVFEPMGMDKAPGMILGLDLMGDRRFIVDYPGLRLLIERTPAQQGG